MHRLFICFALLLSPLLAAEEQELKDSSGKTIARYAVEAPPDMARTVGLFLCFPEHDRPTGDEMLPVRESLKRLGVAGQFVVIGVHPQERKFGVADHEPIQKVIEWAKKKYPVDPRRVYLYGKGEGGKISGQFAMMYPQIAAAAISYSWTWWLMPSNVDVTKGAEFYMVLGMRDLAHHLTNVREGYSRVLAKGYPVIYREVNDLGARTYHPVTNDDAIAWAITRRNKTMPGPSAEVVVEEAARAATSSEPAARRSALLTLAKHANWRSELAQRTLIELALKEGYPDRVSAVDGIIHATRLQLLGARQDTQLFRTLVTLLKDPNEELRTMAANTLMPIRDPEFVGDMKRKERMEPEGGWEAWLQAVEVKAAGYQADYAVCDGLKKEDAVELFCKGRHSFASTLRSAEMGYVPAQAQVGMLYAIGNGVEQNLPEAAKWWGKAAEAGHELAKINYAQVPKPRPAGATPAAR